jgi:hypothetical protein
MKKHVSFFLFLFSALLGNSQAPDWTWLRFLNSTQSDNFSDVDVDQDGNAYVCGTFFGPTVTFAGQTFNSVENSAAILVKRDPAGGLVWARTIDGAECFAVNVDNAGNTYITGYFEVDSVDFGNTVLYNPARFNTSTSAGTNYAMFLVKFDPAGVVLWAKSFDNQLSAKTKGITVTSDLVGNCYVAGTFYIYSSESGAELTLNGASLAMYPGSGLEDVFLVKYNENGEFQWIKTAGGSSYEEPKSIAIDAAGNVLMAGGFSGNVFEFDANSVLTQNNSPNNPREDFFIAKYTPDGVLISANQSISGGSVRCEEIATDNAGNCFITGYFTCDTLTYNGVGLINSDITSNSTSTPLNYDADIFLFKVNAVGEVVWAKSFGFGEGFIANDYAKGVTTDSDGNCYITGQFRTEINFGDINLLSNGFDDVFVTKIDPDGNPLWAQSAGGSASERGDAIVIDAANNVFISGSYDDGTVAQTFNFGSVQATYTGSSTGFLAKLGFNTVGTNPQAGVLDLNLYPNPASSAISIQGDAKLLERISGYCIIDIMGKEITRSEDPFNPNLMAIDGSIPDGMYLIQLFDKEGGILGIKQLVILYH